MNESVIEKPEVVIYSKPHCPACISTKTTLKAMDIPFVDIDISEYPEMLDKIKNGWGYSQVPVVDTGLDRWSGLNMKKLKELEKQYEAFHAAADSSR